MWKFYWKSANDNINKKYNEIIKKRFPNVNLNRLSLNDEENKFYVEYINQIYFQYKKIISDNKTDKNYIINEKIRLDTTIKNKERKNFDSQMLTAPLVTTLVTVTVFLIGQLLNIILNSVNFKAQNTIKNVTNTKIINKATDIYSNFSEKFGNVAMDFSITLIIIIFLYLSIQHWCTKTNEKDNNVEISFNRMCLEVLNNFEEYSDNLGGKNMNEYKTTCYYMDTYFLGILGKESIVLKIKNHDVSLIKDNNITKILIKFDAISDSEADQITNDILGEIITYCTQRIVNFEGINTNNLINKTGVVEVLCAVTVATREGLPDNKEVLDSLDTINQSVHLDNALHYYRLAINVDDKKEKILNLYKVVESIIGYPGGNDNKFKGSLKKLGLGEELDKFKALRNLRNNNDLGHSAGGEVDGAGSYKNAAISNDELENGRKLMQELITNTIRYLKNGGKIQDIFIPNPSKLKK